MSKRPDTDEAARLVTAVAPRRSVEDAVRASGLELLGRCEHLSQVPGLLRDSALLQDFAAEEADILGRAMLRVRARQGQVLIAENDPSDWMLLLLSGTVDVGKHKLDPDTLRPVDENARVAVLRPGAVLGEMSMLDGEPRYASCWALGEVEAAILTRAALAGLIREQPAVGAKLLVKITQLLAQRLRNTSNQLLRRLPRPAT
ncbi:cyclic nucleotide-binding domain-containing protein [Ramlibacter sp. MMS24-I3-19]|uniref:cyclic nucleotide-binding domain-containing protein n=1 Tax=Ramlibacter sp. MMS24-I3-19 TaxID=3416606 RepID=UPI003CFCEC0A